MNGPRRDKGFLDGVEMAVLGKAFHSDDLSPMGARGGHQAAHHRLPIEEHRAGTAFPFGAALLRASKERLFTQEMQEGLFLAAGEGIVLAIDAGLDCLGWPGSAARDSGAPAAAVGWFANQENRLSWKTWLFTAGNRREGAAGENADHGGTV